MDLLWRATSLRPGKETKETAIFRESRLGKKVFWVLRPPIAEVRREAMQKVPFLKISFEKSYPEHLVSERSGGMSTSRVEKSELRKEGCQSPQQPQRETWMEWLLTSRGASPSHCCGALKPFPSVSLFSDVTVT